MGKNKNKKATKEKLELQLDARIEGAKEVEAFASKVERLNAALKELQKTITEINSLKPIDVEALVREPVKKPATRKKTTTKKTTTAKKAGVRKITTSLNDEYDE